MPTKSHYLLHLLALYCIQDRPGVVPCEFNRRTAAITCPFGCYPLNFRGGMDDFHVVWHSWHLNRPLQCCRSSFYTLLDRPSVLFCLKGICTTHIMRGSGVAIVLVGVYCIGRICASREGILFSVRCIVVWAIGY